MPRNFWMITCNEENFNITRRMDFTRQGLKSEYRRKVQRVEKDDRLLYYVMGIRKFTATATVTQSYKEERRRVLEKRGQRHVALPDRNQAGTDT